MISALVCAATILLTGLMARLLGGTGWVQGTASLASATALILMAFGSIYAYDVFDEFWWTLCATILIVLLRDERPQRWLAFGLVAGLELLTKETILFWGFALVVGLGLSPQRRLLFTRWTLFGGLIAFALFLPFLLWNATSGWASFQYWASYSHYQSARESPLAFLLNQIFGMNPLSVLLWGAGLWYFFSARGARYRVFGWAYLLLFVLFLSIGGKVYFLAPAYPPLFAGGALLLGGWRVGFRRWIAVYPVVLALCGLLLAPVAMPVLPPAVYAQVYGQRSSAGAGDRYGLPSNLANRFGWEEQVALIAQVYHSLPPDEQRVACIFTENYGEASALVQFGGRYHLPPPISGHNAFYLWGPDGCTGQVAIMDQLGEPGEWILVREGEISYNVLTASLFYHLLAHLSTVPIPREVGDFRLLDRHVVDVLVGQRSRGAVERNSNPGFLIHRENLVCFRGGPCMNGTRQILPVRFQGGGENALQTRQILLSLGFVLDNSARKELEQRKDDFINMASHELRSPLTVLKLQTTLLHRQLARQGLQDVAPALSNMQTQINAITRLVEELLDVSKIQAGRLEYRQERVDLDALLREIADTMQQTHPSHRILVQGAVQASLLGDRDRLGEVFTNLLSNAIKYSPDAQTVEVELSASPETVTVTVRDHGLGIPREQREKIFERFYRAAGPKQRAIPGLGMGLYIVAEIVKRHGGTIVVDSEVGKGSSFTVTLPLTRGA